jgi:hypothetical protein
VLVSLCHACFRPFSQGWIRLDVRLVLLWQACLPLFLREGLRLDVRVVSLSHACLPPFLRQGLRLDVVLVSLYHTCFRPFLQGWIRLDVRLVSLCVTTCPFVTKTGIKGKVHPRTGHESPEGEQKYSCTLSLTSALDWDVWSTPRPGRFTPVKETRYPLYRLGEPQGRSGRVRKISPPPGFDPRTVQPIASRYTDYAIPGHSHSQNRSSGAITGRSQSAYLLNFNLSQSSCSIHPCKCTSPSENIQKQQ